MSVLTDETCSDGTHRHVTEAISLLYPDIQSDEAIKLMLRCMEDQSVKIQSCCNLAFQIRPSRLLVDRVRVHLNYDQLWLVIVEAVAN